MRVEKSHPLCGHAIQVRRGRSVPAGGTQLPGDSNQDARLDVSDLIRVAQVLFVGGATFPCDGGDVMGPGNLALIDSNGDGRIDISDPQYLAGFLFGTCGSGPPCPAHVLGTDCVPIAGCPDVSPCPSQ